MVLILKVEKETQTASHINQDAINRYNDYFNYLLNHNTFELNLINGQKYYTFSSVPFPEWQEVFATSTGMIGATEFLDKLVIENLNIQIVKSVKDVTATVKNQYRKQKDVIFSSYELVKQILFHSEKKIVKDAINLVEKSRKNTESKRKYWRVINEQYYGLDIHPLMEYELEELQKVLYACAHYNENPNYKTLSWVLGSTAVVVGGIVVGYVVLQAI